jgi:hypothetical protein
MAIGIEDAWHEKAPHHALFANPIAFFSSGGRGQCSVLTTVRR